MCQPDETPAAQPELDADFDAELEAEFEAELQTQLTSPQSVLEPTAAARCFKLMIAYDGAAFFGWQRQASARTVQATLEDAIASVTGASKVRLLASSRTDTGVHAIGQCATFRSTAWRAPARNLPLAVNTQLPDDVIIRSAEEVPMTFNPIRNAIGKRYRYQVYASRVSNPLSRGHAWWVKKLLDIQAMQQAAQLLVGTHDFISFQSVGSPRISTVRTVTHLEISSQPHLDGQLITIEIQANGFLYNMVRNIVGTLVQVGRGRKSIAWVSEVLASGDRRRAGQTAPAHGLCLLEVYFQSQSSKANQLDEVVLSPPGAQS